MTQDMSVEEYIAMQPKLEKRRSLMRSLLIRQIGFRLVKMTVTGAENIPDSGPAIAMINHTAAIDPGLVMGAVMNRFVIPMTKIENTRHPLGWLAVKWWGAYTVRREEVDRKALTNSIELLKSGQLILIAPEGTRQKNGLNHPKEGMTYIATKADAVIIPAAISGAMGFTKKWQGLQRPEIHLNFGQPFKFKTDGRKRIPREELAKMTEEAMYQLSAALTDPSLRGVYSDLSKMTTEHITFINS
jgi:1-acyl-sn-glycerol-3-phosphate acyltransferase